MRTIFLSSAVLLAATLAANAISYKPSHPRCEWFADHDAIFTKLNARDKNPSNDSYTGWFNILKDGYDPDYYSIRRVEAWFLLSDDSNKDREEWVTIELGRGATGLGPVEIDFNDWLGGPLRGPAKERLSNTGRLKYTVTATRGDVHLKRAKVVVCADHERRHNVTDTGVTGSLLGVNLLGLAFLRRKLPKA